VTQEATPPRKRTHIRVLGAKRPQARERNHATLEEPQAKMPIRGLFVLTGEREDLFVFDCLPPAVGQPMKNPRMDDPDWGHEASAEHTAEHDAWLEEYTAKNRSSTS
jgi:hypothetical protein